MTRTVVSWKARAENLALDGRPVIDGLRVDGPKDRVSEKVNPATGLVISEVHNCGPEELDSAVAAARRTFERGPWSTSDVGYRRERLLRLASLIEDHIEEFALYDSLDMGKPVEAALNFDAPGAAALFRFYAEAIEKHEDLIPATPGGSTALVTREPVGVVGAIVPWNFPLGIATWKVAPALASGNSVILKPSTESPHSALFLGELAAAAGIPRGVFNVLPGLGSVLGRAMATHEGIDMLTFTGSTGVGKQLQVHAGQSNMKRLALEAGGKSSNIVFADTADLSLAAEQSAAGSFKNQGEVCSANSRIFVERSVYEEFLELYIAATKKYQPGDPLDPASGSGSLVSESHADKVWEAIQGAEEQGTIVCGGKRPEIHGSRAFIEPTIVVDVPPDHPLHSEEIFGPVAVVAPFDSEADVVASANATPYGLAASVWTGSFSRAHEVSRKLIAGTVSVNTVDAVGFTTPFGGFKQSGFGRDLSIHALENYTDYKTTWMQWG